MEKEAVVRYLGGMVDLDAADAQRVRERFVRIEAAKGQYLLRAGELCQQVFFVLAGVVRCSIVSAKGEDITCYFSQEGQFVSNYESFLDGKPSHYGLQCLEDCTLLAIDRLGLQELYATTRHGERLGRLVAERLFVETIDRLTSFYVRSPEERYADFLAAHPGLSQRIPQHYIAAYIGVRPPSLSRIKRRAMAMAGHSPG